MLHLLGNHVCRRIKRIKMAATTVQDDSCLTHVGKGQSLNYVIMAAIFNFLAFPEDALVP